MSDTQGRIVKGANTMFIDEGTIWDSIKKHGHPGHAISALAKGVERVMMFSGGFVDEIGELRGTFNFCLNLTGCLQGEVINRASDTRFKISNGRLTEIREGQQTRQWVSFRNPKTGDYYWNLDWKLDKVYGALITLPDPAMKISDVTCDMPQDESARRSVVRQFAKLMVLEIRTHKPRFNFPASDFALQRILNNPCWKISFTPAEHAKWNETHVQEVLDLTIRRMFAYMRSRCIGTTKDTDPAGLFSLIDNEISAIYGKAIGYAKEQREGFYRVLDWSFQMPSDRPNIYAARELSGNDAGVVVGLEADTIVCVDVFQEHADQTAATMRWFVIEDTYGWPMPEIDQDSIKMTLDYHLTYDHLANDADPAQAVTPHYIIRDIIRPDSALAEDIE